MKNKILIIFSIIVVIGVVVGILVIKNNKKSNSTILNNNSVNVMNDERNEKYMIKLNVNDTILNIEPENNSSSIAFIEKLKTGEIIINAQDYGNFEKVGDLGFNLPTNDEKITTEAGDLILYQGNKITLYYDTNTWTFTKLGKVQNISQEELKKILGTGDIILKFSLDNTKTTNK